MAKKLSFIWLMLFLSFFSNTQSTKFSISKSKNQIVTEQKILDTIFKLPECEARAAYIEKQTKGKRHLGIVIYQRPSGHHPYYWVKAWEYNGMNYATHFNFYIYPNPFSIKFLDIAKDKAISLKEWRQQRK